MNATSTRVLLVSWLALAALCRPSTAGITYSFGEKEDLPETSIVAVLANPEALAGKWIDITGFLAFEPRQEISSLCLSKEAHTLGLQVNCLFIDLDWGKLGLTPEEAAEINFQYVSVQGLVAPSSKGHFSMNAAGIVKVRYVFLVERSWLDARRLKERLDEGPDRERENETD